MLKAEISRRCDGEEKGERGDDDGRGRWKWRWWRESEEQNSPSPEIRERECVTAKCLGFVSRWLCFVAGESNDEWMQGRK